MSAAMLDSCCCPAQKKDSDGTANIIINIITHVSNQANVSFHRRAERSVAEGQNLVKSSPPLWDGACQAHAKANIGKTADSPQTLSKSSSPVPVLPTTIVFPSPTSRRMKGTISSRVAIFDWMDLCCWSSLIHNHVRFSLNLSIESRSDSRLRCERVNRDLVVSAVSIRDLYSQHLKIGPNSKRESLVHTRVKTSHAARATSWLQPINLV